MRNLTLIEQLEAVNEAVNKRVEYADDDSLYFGDHWSAPYETAIYKRDDCDGYALLKKTILEYLGVPEQKMSIALIAWDDKKGEANHAALIVEVVPKGFLVLSNNEKTLLLEETQHWLRYAYKDGRFHVAQRSDEIGPSRERAYSPSASLQIKNLMLPTKKL